MIPHHVLFVCVPPEPPWITADSEGKRKFQGWVEKLLWVGPSCRFSNWVFSFNCIFFTKSWDLFLTQKSPFPVSISRCSTKDPGYTNKLVFLKLSTSHPPQTWVWMRFSLGLLVAGHNCQLDLFFFSSTGRRHVIEPIFPAFPAHWMAFS